jgi:hypothetical protein
VLYQTGEGILDVKKEEAKLHGKSTATKHCQKPF